MNCPFCKKGLVSGEDRLFQTDIEHVCDPNCDEYDPPPRPTFECSCVFSRSGFWDEDGGFYPGVSTRGQLVIFAKMKYTSAIFSRCRMIDRQVGGNGPV